MLTRNLTRRITQALTRKPTEPGNGGAASFDPASLFSSGEQGVWYDPSDFSTMFQDSAGTTPVTAVEQPVGLMLDKRLGLVRGPNISLIASFKKDTDGSIFAYLLDENASNVGKFFEVELEFVSPPTGSGLLQFLGGGTTHYFGAISAGRWRGVLMGGTWKLRIGGTTTDRLDVINISVRELPGNHASQSTTASKPKLSARKNLLLATETLSTQSVTVKAASHVLSFYGTGTITLSGASTAGPLVGTGVSDRVSLTFTPTAGSVTFTVSGSVTDAQLEYGSATSSYQLVTTATDYDVSAHFLHLAFDGVDDFLSTGSIDFTSTDELSVGAAIHKLSDAATGAVVELSASAAANNGAFLLSAPDGASATFAFDSKGTLQTDAVATGHAAPKSAVLSGSADISGDSVSLRVNGAAGDTDAGDQGTGNFGNYPLYIGRRGGASLPFNGHLYGLVVRGALNDANSTASMESYLAEKSGVTL